jgi:F1F0 ATPase subunit 2
VTSNLMGNLTGNLTVNLVTSETFNLLMALIVGMVLGLLFFGGLLWTVRRVISTKLSAGSLLVSLLLRMLVTSAGFYVVSEGQWLRLLICLLGFMLARSTVLSLSRQNQIRMRREGSHAP